MARRRRSRRGLMLSLFLATMLLAYVIHQYREVISEKITAWEVDPTGDCAVVLTGGPGRVKEALSLLSRKLVKKLIISGAHPEAELREILPQWPFAGEVSETDVVIDRRSTSTYGNAQQTLPIVEALNCHEIILVTSQYHMSRAYKTFSSTYPKSIPIIKHTLISGFPDNVAFEIGWEVLKSCFYALWAY